MRVSTPLTMLFVLSAFIMFVSHHYFSLEKPARKVVRHRHSRATVPTSMSESLVGAYGGTDHDLPAQQQQQQDVLPEEDEDDSNEEEEGMASDDAEEPVGARGGGGGGGGRGGGEDDGGNEEEAVEEEEGETPDDTADIEDEDGVVGVARGGKVESSSSGLAAGTSAADQLASIVAAAKTAMVPYPDPADEVKCTPNALKRPTRTLDYVAPPGGDFPTNCKGRAELCEVVRKTAIHREVLVAVCNSGIINQLSKWVESNRRAKIDNMMIVAIDSQLPKWLEENKVAYWKRTTSAAGSHKISAQKFQYVREFLSTGCSVLMSDIDVVYLQNPFLFIHHDSDVEGTTDGWDDGSAYGWTERLDDPSLGAAGRFRPSMRITAWNSGLWYIAATQAGLRMMSILAHRMATEDTWDQAAVRQRAPPAPAAPRLPPPLPACRRRSLLAAAPRLPPPLVSLLPLRPSSPLYRRCPTRAVWRGDVAPRARRPPGRRHH